MLDFVASTEPCHRPRYEPWEHSDARAYGELGLCREQLAENLRQGLVRSLAHRRDEWPDRKLFFVSDLHADYAAFLASLEAVGAITVLGEGPQAFVLTREGETGRIIIGGDCLDKGPSNLDLLSAIGHLKRLGADVTLLAGNHDLRFVLGLRSLGLPEGHRSEHFFLRMGPKVVPLLREVLDRYVGPIDKLRDQFPDLPAETECRRWLYPSETWFERFPDWAGECMSAEAIGKELKRMREKFHSFEGRCQQAGLNLCAVYVAARQCQKLFMHPHGEFAWFFDSMRLVHQEGAFLFLHAGLDDWVAREIADKGIDGLNRRFWKEAESDGFAFYFGPMANVFRTKYRCSDWPLSQEGVSVLRDAGIHAVVHGHQNRKAGQRMALREGLLHIECDITLDRHSRQQEGLVGPGVGGTIICPEGQIIGISSDYPFAKVLDPLALV